MVSADDQTGQGGDDANPKVLYLGFAAIILFIGIIAWYGQHQAFHVVSSLKQVVNTYNRRMEKVQDMRIWARERSAVLQAAADHNDPFARQELLETFMELGERFMLTRAELVAEDLDPTEIELLEKHRDAARTVAPLQRKAMELIADERLDEARTLLAVDIYALQAKAVTALDNFLDHEHQRAQEARAAVERAIEEGRMLLGVLALIGILISTLIAASVSVRLRNMLRHLADARDHLEERVAQRTAELQEARDKMERLALYDALTGLPNRRLFYDTLNLYLPRAKRNRNYAGLLFIDLDGFKSVNDNYGHDYGDDLLRQVAKRLTSCTRKEDLVARMGGDEFTIIVGDMKDPNAAETVGQKIIREIRRPFTVIDQEIRIGSSVGIALFPTHATDRDGLIKAADDMMYVVKKAGKNAYRVYQNDSRAVGHS